VTNSVRRSVVIPNCGPFALSPWAVPLINKGREPLDDESIFRLFVDQVSDYAIFLLAPAGDVATWNPGAERIKGYKATEIIGKHFRISIRLKTLPRESRSVS
jgi:PAS domain-containing protein